MVCNILWKQHFSKKSYSMHDVCVKNFQNVDAKLNELGHKIKSLVLNRGAK